MTDIQDRTGGPQFDIAELARAFEAIVNYDHNVAVFVRHGQSIHRAMAIASVIAYPALQPLAERIGPPYWEPDMTHARCIAGARAAGDRVLERFDSLISTIAAGYSSGVLPPKVTVVDFPGTKREPPAAETTDDPS